MQRSFHRILPAVAAVGITLLLAACGNAADGDSNDDGGAAPAAGGASDYTLVASEFTFEPDTLTVPADETITVTVDNSGGVIEHDFTLDEADAHIYADAGDIETGSFSVPAGTYTFYCAVPGHRASGMEGTLTAE